MSDIVKEIEVAQKDADSWRNILFDQHQKSTRYGKTEIPTQGLFELADYLQKLADTLQRAREALRWIPCEERLPEKSGNYRTTESIQPMGAEGFLYLLNFSYFDKTTKQWKGRGKIVAWMERPSPYTPEEK